MADGGWIYLSPDEIAEANGCNCEICRLIVADGVESPDKVGYLRAYHELDDARELDA